MTLNEVTKLLHEGTWMVKGRFIHDKEYAIIGIGVSYPGHDFYLVISNNQFQNYTLDESKVICVDPECSPPVIYILIDGTSYDTHFTEEKL